MSKKLCWIITCILLFPIMAEGADWVEVSGSDISIYYVDVSNVEKVASNQYRAWYKIEAYNNDLKKAVVYSLIDCDEKRTKDLQGTYYNINGTIEYRGEEKWQYAVPDSNIANVLHVVCDYKKGVLNIPKREDNFDKR